MLKRVKNNFLDLSPDLDLQTYENIAYMLEVNYQ